MNTVPDEKQCLNLLILNQCPDKVILHCQKVKEVALMLNHQLISPFSNDLITAAALLHDICRTQPDHCIAGANLLVKLGYAEIARIIYFHHDLIDDHFDERHLIYLADKRVQGTNIVSLEERFFNKLNHFTETSAKEACLRRYQEAQNIQKQYERMCQNENH